MGSGERKRCSNMAPVRRLRSLAWIKARRLPGVRCSTLNTECKSLLCLMIMPGRSWVAGIDIAGLHLLHFARNYVQRGGPSAALGRIVILHRRRRGSPCGAGPDCRLRSRDELAIRANIFNAEVAEDSQRAQRKPTRLTPLESQPNVAKSATLGWGTQLRIQPLQIDPASYAPDRHPG